MDGSLASVSSAGRRRETGISGVAVGPRLGVGVALADGLGLTVGGGVRMGRGADATRVLPVESGGVAPDLFQRVIGPGFGREDVDHEVAVVDQGPSPFF